MNQLKSLGIRNLRSFSAEKQPIDIKKINILVGKNSCGKSTFARVFPLLKQSLVAKTSQTPILWNGPIIDFGDFSTALRDSKTSLSFDFQFQFLASELHPFRRPRATFSAHFDSEEKEGSSQKIPPMIDIDLSLIIEKDQDGKKLSNTIMLHAHDIEITFNYNDSKFYNNFRIQELTERYFIKLDLKKELEHENLILPYEPTFGFVPDFFYLMRRVVKSKTEDQQPNKYEPDQPLRDFAADKILQKIKKYFKKGTSLEKVKRTCFEIQWVKQDDFIEHLKYVFRRYSFFCNKLDRITIQEEILKNIYAYSIVLAIPNYMDYINIYLSATGRNITYIAPVRAISERYYRYQNLSVEEMDSTGMNLPMVLNSLSLSEREALSEWVKDSFNFELELKVDGPHYELLIKSEDDHQFHNISDMGFGYSQLLPIIVSIWLKDRNSNSYIFSRRRSTEKIYVIEQPELHLHPALQYQFGKMLSKVIQDVKGKDIRFIIETHSKSIIDALGDEIRQSNLNNNDVGIYLFEKNKATTETQIRSASFSDDGYLQDWPLGFLTA